MKINLKRIIIFLLILGGTFLLTKYNKIIDIHENFSENKRINILMINSYHQGHYWEGFVLEGLKDKLSEYEEYDINLKIEYLDFRNKNNENYIEIFRKLLESKYEYENIDIMYSVNDESYNFVTELHQEKDSVFYEVPIVMTGVDQKLDKDDDKIADTLGFYHVGDTINLLHLIADLDRNISKLNIIMEDSLYCESVTNEILYYLSTVNELVERKIDVEIIKSNYIEDVCTQLESSRQSSNTANIIAGEFEYKSSNTLLKPKETIKRIKQVNSYPIYSNDQTYLNEGILGGCVDIGQVHGNVAADLIMSALNKTNEFEYLLEPEPLAQVYVDYNGIYEYNIDVKDISSNMNIINKKWYQIVVAQELKMPITVTFISFLVFLFIGIAKKIKGIKLKKEYKEEQKIIAFRKKLRNELIVNLSHELRTPINMILNTSRTMKHSTKRYNDELTKKDIENKLSLVDTNAYRLLKISNNIIDLTKAEEGQLGLSINDENIVSVVEEVFISSADFARQREIEMQFHSSCDIINLAIDKNQIQRVILNLISNAIKFSNKKGKIDIDIYIENKEVIIKIKDNGKGIEEEKLKRIFDYFYQGDKSFTRISEGVGIGLSISKEIIDIHGGKIEVESLENVGTLFKIYLPISKSIESTNKNKVFEIGSDINTMTNIELSDLM